MTTNTDYSGAPFDVDALTKHFESALEKKDSRWHDERDTTISLTLMAKDTAEQSASPNQYRLNFEIYEWFVNLLLGLK